MGYVSTSLDYVHFMTIDRS